MVGTNKSLDFLSQFFEMTDYTIKVQIVTSYVNSKLK